MSADGHRERHYTTFDGLRLFFRDWGDPLAGEAAVLCLPGLTRNSKDFNRLARHLSRDRRVVAPDLRGRGRSAYARDWRSYEPRVYLEDLRHLLASLGLGHAIVVGTSMGGLLGMALAVVLPGAIKGLVINDVGPEVNQPGSKRILAYVATDRPQPDWPSAAAHLRQLLPTLSLKSDEEWLDFARHTFCEGEDGLLHFDWDVDLAKPFAAGSGGAEDNDLWRLWRAVRRIPTLAIRGGVSDILSEATFARMKAEKPDLDQVTVPGVGHAPTLDEPECREAVDEFFRRH